MITGYLLGDVFMKNMYKNEQYFVVKCYNYIWKIVMLLNKPHYDERR